MKSKEQLAEEWKTISYNDLYEVSNLGRVRIKNHRGLGYARLLRPSIHKGYETVFLCKQGSRKRFSVHRLVMTEFSGKSELHINHKNGIKNDNRLENLEYCTHQENIKHAFKNSLIKSARGERASLAVLTEYAVKRIKKETGTDTEIAIRFNVSRGAVYAVRAGRTWKHVK